MLKMQMAKTEIQTSVDVLFWGAKKSFCSLDMTNIQLTNLEKCVISRYYEIKMTSE